MGKIDGKNWYNPATTGGKMNQTGGTLGFWNEHVGSVLYQILKELVNIYHVHQ